MHISQSRILLKPFSTLTAPHHRRSSALPVCTNQGLRRSRRTAGCRTEKRILALASSDVSTSSAKEAIEDGLSKFQGGEYSEALQLFSKALELSPRPEEAQAALYNSACCQTKLKLWQEAASSVAEAVNSYSLKLDVALKDKDLAPLRERREWRDVAESLSGTLSAKNLISVRAEQKAPFRLFRLLFAGGLGTGALVGLLIILTRLFSAFKGGEGAPEISETLTNLAINGIAVAVLGFLIARDIKGQQKDRSIIEREEALAKLQVRIGADRVVTMDTLRGTKRAVIVAGSRGQVGRSLKAAAPLLDVLQDRGIVAVPLVLSQDDPDQKLAALKAEFRPSKGFAKAPEAASTSGAEAGISGREKGKPGTKFELEAFNTGEWSAWLAELKQDVSVQSSQLYIQQVKAQNFIQVQLDGSVRSSGRGSPPWQKFCEDLPALDSLQTRLTDGIRQ